jgi:hypothetical protein
LLGTKLQSFIWKIERRGHNFITRPWDVHLFVTKSYEVGAGQSVNDNRHCAFAELKGEVVVTTVATSSLSALSKFPDWISVSFVLVSYDLDFYLW